MTWKALGRRNMIEIFWTQGFNLCPHCLEKGEKADDWLLVDEFPTDSKAEVECANCGFRLILRVDLAIVGEDKEFLHEKD